MRKPKGFIAITLVLALLATNALIYGQAEAKSAAKSDGQATDLKQETGPAFGKSAALDQSDSFKPLAIGGKAKADTEIKKKKFPWLLVGGILVAGTVAAVLLLKKKKESPAGATPGSIQVESTPSGAAIFMDGGDTGKTTNSTITNVTAGDHKVRLVKQGYFDFEQSVTVPSGKTAKLTATLIKNIELVPIPGGTFTMGTDLWSAVDSEKPAHQVTLNGFKMGKFEVTQEQWESVMGSNPSYFRGSLLPVEQVSWDHVQTFIGNLNAATGMNYRLPTEAEWEYACRGGTTGPRYGELSAIAWYYDNSGGTTHEVGGKAPNNFGLYDIMGNVYEWVADYWGYYSPGPQTNPKGPSSGTIRVVRDGCFLEQGRYMTASTRGNQAPSFGCYTIGFRLASD